MWWTKTVPMAALFAVVSASSCEYARTKCIGREDCVSALQNYMMGCSLVLKGPDAPTYCPDICVHSLVSLVSTVYGKNLTECRCNGEKYCEELRRRTEICQPQIKEIMETPVVACSMAQRICQADAQCRMAFHYYVRNCKAMFSGTKCRPKCHNSINILLRQVNAQKLKSCYCDGTEDYDCPAIQHNMMKLCFHKSKQVRRPVIQRVPTTTTITTTTTTTSSPRYELTLIPEVRRTSSSSSSTTIQFATSVLWIAILCVWM